MIVKPLFYMEHLADSDIAKYECSDKIWLGRNEYERWVMSCEPGQANIVRLTNGVDQSVIGSVYNMHHNDEEPDTIFVPSWMFQELQFDDEYVTIERHMPSLCTGLTIQPHTSDHIHAPDPQELLRDAFEQYSCLTMGQTIPLWISYPEPHTFHVTITNLNPGAQDGETLCIQSCEVELDLLRPLDLPEESPVPQEKEKEQEKEPVMDSMISHILPSSMLEPAKVYQGQTTGGTVPEGKSRRELALEAAMRRMGKST
jgi:hypothetical protein